MEQFDYKRAVNAVKELTLGDGSKDAGQALIAVGFIVLKGLSIISSQLDEIYMEIPAKE